MMFMRRQATDDDRSSTRAARRRILNHLTNVAIAAAACAALLTVPSAAHAEPATCSHYSVFWATSGSGWLLHGEGIGECELSAVRTLRVQIKSNQWPSDIVITWADDHRLGTWYNPEVSACDNGATHEYYARSYFTQSVTWQDAGYQTYTTCN